MVPGILWGQQAMEDAVKLEALDAEEASHRSSPHHGSGGRTVREQDEDAGSHAAFHLLRTTHQNHVNLSMMADQKASILIGASFVLLTILFANLREHQITVPLTVLTVTTMTAAFFAILTVMPCCMSTRQMHRNQINPLFFGAFASLDWDEYESMIRGSLSKAGEEDPSEGTLRAKNLERLLDKVGRISMDFEGFSGSKFAEEITWIYVHELPAAHVSWISVKPPKPLYHFTLTTLQMLLDNESKRRLGEDVVRAVYEIEGSAWDEREAWKRVGG
jgi:Pycsar effector protein